MAIIPNTAVTEASKPGSTVNSTTPTANSAPPAAMDAAAQKKLQDTISKVGYQPRNQQEVNMFNRMAFNPDELKKYGLDQDYQSLSSQTTAARESLSATPPPTNTGLRVLQDALNEKSSVTNQALGESDLFKKAGLSGYTVLRDTMTERMREMDTKYNSFKTTVGDAAGAMTDTYNLALDRYKLLKDELDAQDQSMMTMLDEALEYERMMDKMTQEHKLDMESKAYQSELDKRTKAMNGYDANYDDFAEDIDPQIYEEGKAGLDSIFTLGTAEGWCGEFASRLSTATKVGDSWAEKKAHIDKRDNPKAGDKLLLPMGVSDGKGYGHVATVLSYNPKSGDVLVIESNRDGRQNKGKGPGVSTIGVYNMADMKSTYGNGFGFASGELRPQYQGAIEIADKMVGSGQAALMAASPDLYQPQQGAYQKQLKDMPVVGEYYSGAFANDEPKYSAVKTAADYANRYMKEKGITNESKKQSEKQNAENMKKIEQIILEVESMDITAASKKRLIDQRLAQAGLVAPEEAAGKSKSGSGAGSSLDIDALVAEVQGK